MRKLIFTLFIFNATAITGYCQQPTDTTKKSFVKALIGLFKPPKAKTENTAQSSNPDDVASSIISNSNAQAASIIRNSNKPIPTSNAATDIIKKSDSDAAKINSQSSEQAASIVKNAAAYTLPRGNGDSIILESNRRAAALLRRARYKHSMDTADSIMTASGRNAAAIITSSNNLPKEFQNIRYFVNFSVKDILSKEVFDKSYYVAARINSEIVMLATGEIIEGEVWALLDFDGLLKDAIYVYRQIKTLQGYYESYLRIVGKK